MLSSLPLTSALVLAAPLFAIPSLAIAPRSPAQADDEVRATLPSREIDEHPGGVEHLAVDPKGRVLFACSVRADRRASEIHAWDLRKEEELWRVPVDKIAVVGIDAGEEIVVYNLGVPAFTALRADTGEELRRHGAPSGAATTSIAVDPRDRWIWLGTAQGAARLDVQNLQAYNLRAVEGGGIGCVALDPRGSLLALGCADGGVRFVNAKSASVDDEKILSGHEGAVTAVAFARNAKTVISGGEDGTARVWDVRSGKERARVEAGAPIASLAVDEKGKILAAGDARGGLTFWSLPGGEPLARVPAATPGPLADLVFLGGELAGAGGGTKVVLWDVSEL